MHNYSIYNIILYKYIGTETLTEGIKEEFIKRIREDYTPDFKDRALTLRRVYENWRDSSILYDGSYYNSYDIVRYQENGGKEYIYTDWNKAINKMEWKLN